MVISRKDSDTHSQTKKILLWLFFLVGLIANLLLFTFFFMVKVGFGLFSLQPIWLYPVFFLLLIGVGVTAYGLITLAKLLDTGKTFLLTQKTQATIMLWAASIASFIAIGMVTYLAWSLTHEQPPQLFPFNDPDATYTITKHGENYMLKYESTGDMNTRQVCDLISGKTECRTEVDREIEAMIGKSDVPLEPLLGARVKVDGNFVYADQQCIAGQCHHIGGWATLDILSIDP